MKIEFNWPDGLPIEHISTVFIQGMLDRMAMSFFKYGQVNQEDISKRDMEQTLKMRFDRYLDDGNTEWLMDVGNFAMIEFMCPSHPDAHFRDTDSDESPGVVLKDGSITHKHARDL